MASRGAAGRSDAAAHGLPLDAATRLARVEGMVSQLPGLLWATDAELRFDLVSDIAARRFGIAAGQPLAGSPLAGGGGAGLAAHRRALAGESTRYDLSVGGAEFNCLVQAWRDAQGRVVGVLGSAEDTAERRDAAATITSQHKVFEAMLDQSLVGIGICDVHGRFLFVNATLRQVAEQDPSGQSLPAALRVWGQWCADGAAVPVEEWPLARAMRGEVIEGREMYRDRPDGRRDHLLVAATPVHDVDGALLGAVITTADITSRKQMEDETRRLNETLEQRVRERTLEFERAQQTLSHVLDHSTAVIYLKDPDGRYLRINRYYEQLFGVTNADFVGRTDADLFPADVVAALRANDQQVLDSGRSLHIEEVVPTAGKARTYLSVKFPLRDVRGQIYGVCGISTDITERKRVEAELRRSQATLTAVIDSALDPIWALAADFTLIAFNAAAARFIEDLVGQPPSLVASLRHLIPPDIAARWMAYIPRVLAGERFTVEESLTINEVGHRLLVSLAPMMEGGRVTGVVVFSKDITELMRAEEQARQHQAELAHVLRLHTMGELAASFAHEVNQPLGVIANYAQGVRRRLDGGGIDSAELRESVEAIAHEALRAGEITRRVRRLLRKEDEPRRRVDINEIVSTALRVTEPTAHLRAVALSAHLAPALPALLADAIQVEQVLINLILNGIEAIPPTHATRQVDVRTTATSGGVEVVVCDTGLGIDPSLVDDVFRPFLTTKPGGLGMGLAISRSIIEAHGGRLWAAAGDGGGAALHVTLPAA